MEMESAFARRDEKAVACHGWSASLHAGTRVKAAARALLPWATVLVLASGIALYGATPRLQDAQAYLQSRAAVAAHPEVEAQFGTPLAVAAPSGSIQLSSAQGAKGAESIANLQFGIAGPKGEGIAYVEARGSPGRWEIEYLVVENDNGARIQIR